MPAPFAPSAAAELAMAWGPIAIATGVWLAAGVAVASSLQRRDHDAWRRLLPLRAPRQELVVLRATTRPRGAAAVRHHERTTRAGR
jgi:hypothetical protein